ncbi:hypothetical protein [Bacillus sp. FJAT-22090]|uniref:hypothetical protein n=1 Tax=Bacillus sp. FJAT-22090 TaxID=1581038 RepID=UPI0011A18AB7|nr:hypothetical protein [Bacillus sp. FJAT-22090]
MFKKKNYLLAGAMLSAILLVSACSNDEATNETDTKGVTNSTSEFLALSGDTVTEQGGCVLASRFSAGDKIVFRANAIDPETKEQAKDAELQVHLSTGEVLDMAYGEHGEDNFWVIAYPVTADTPTGSLDYYITAKDGDKSGEYRPFNVQPSLISIVAPDATAAATEEPATEEEVDLATVETNQTLDLVAKNFVFEGKDGAKTFYVKAGEEVTLNVATDEGAHGLAIDGIDEATVADANGTVKFTPTKTGEYNIFCTVFCGAGHGDMVSKLVVVQ